MVQVNTTGVILYPVRTDVLFRAGRGDNRRKVVQQSGLVTLRGGDQVRDARRGRRVGRGDGRVHVFGDKVLARLGEEETDRVDKRSEAGENGGKERVSDSVRG